MNCWWTLFLDSFNREARRSRKEYHHDTKEFMETSWAFRDDMARNRPAHRAPRKALDVPSSKSETVQERLERLTQPVADKHRNHPVRAETPGVDPSVFPAGIQ